MILVYLGRWPYGRFKVDNNIFYKMKNDLTTGTWQNDIWCPIIIILLCTYDVQIIWYLCRVAVFACWHAVLTCRHVNTSCDCVETSTNLVYDTDRLKLGGPAHLFPPIVFYSDGNAFFWRSEFGKKLHRWATVRSHIFDMTVNMIANPIKLPGTMPAIWLEISEFGIHHATLNHFQCGMMIFNFWFWLISGSFLNKTVSALMPTKIKMTTFSSLAPLVLQLPAKVLQQRQCDQRQGIFLIATLRCSGW